MSQRSITNFLGPTSPLVSKPNRSLSDSTPSPSTTKKRSPKLLLPSGSPSLNASFSRKRKLDDDDNAQMVLDAGQKKFGAEQCNQCYMFYTPDHKEDSKLHREHHKRSLTSPLVDQKLIRLDARTSRFLVKMQAVQEFLDAKIYRIMSSSPASVKRKLEWLLENVVNEELGSMASSPLWSENSQAFVYVTDGVRNSLAACVIVETIHKASKLHFDPVTHRAEASSEIERASLGVNRVWVHQSFRRRGIATRLLDCARCNLLPGCPVPRSLVAFSDPTAAGIRLASRMAGGLDKVLVYKL